MEFRHRQPGAVRLRPSTGWLSALLITVALVVTPSVAQVASDEAVVSEDLLAQAGKEKFRKRQNRPIRLGTSGGNGRDFTIDGQFANVCGGTLGALIEKNGEHYILSNNHVMARSNLARKRDMEPIGQPSLADQNAPGLMPARNIVARLSNYKRIKFNLDLANKVDAAIAEVGEGTVQRTGKIINIGIPGNTPVPAEIGMAVKKAGRTTGLTRGRVTQVDVTATVTYEPRCGSEQFKTARFVNQIVVMGNNAPFSEAGDSGSMVYQDVRECPAPVGLLFAGNEEIAVLNPADKILRIMGNLKPRGQARFVGCSSSAPPTLSTRSTSTAVSVSAQSTPRTEGMDLGPIIRAKRLREAEMLDIPGVHAIGVGISLEGEVEPAIHVFVSRNRPEVMDRIPATIGGYRTEVIPTDPIVAY